MEAKRNSYIFYRSFYDAIKELDAANRLIMYEAVANYALDRKEPILKGVLKTIWLLIKPKLDANWRMFENGCKGGEYGYKGGAPKGNKNALKKTTQ